jgi:hypothetical protein
MMLRRFAILLGVVVALGAGGAVLIQLAENGATEFAVDGDTLTISGPVSGAATERLERLLEQTPGLDRVVLGDLPGTDDLSWLVGMGYLILGAGLETVADGEIVNDAILLFAAGESRVMGEGRLVLRSDALARRLGQPVDRRASAPAERVRYLERVLGDAGFARFEAEMRASRDEHVMTGDEMRRFGLLDGF